MTTPSLPYRSAARVAFSVFDMQRFQFDVAGLDHMPAEGGAVLAVNHTSYWDFFAAGRPAYDTLGRPARILAKASLFDIPVFGSLMRSAQHVPVVRGAGRDAFEIATERLNVGDLILVLPEQTISPTFDLLPFKTGAVRMAAQAGVPLVPCAVWGIHRFHTTGRRPRWSWRLPITIRYGPALHPRLNAEPALGTRDLANAVQGLLDDAIASYPDGSPAGEWWVPARLGGSAPTAFQRPAYGDQQAS